MAKVTRGTKIGGGTDFQDGTTIEASEVNTDFNTLFNLVNGNIDGANISSVPWSDITGTKNPEDIDDTSGTVAEMDTDKDPGDASSLNLAMDLEDELQHLRRQVKRLTVGEGVIRRDTSSGASNEDVAWYELAARGPNLIPNGDLDLYTGDSTSQDPPDAWTKAATPTTLAPVSLSASEGEGQAIHIVANAASEGIQQTIDGLKASTRYLLQVKAKVASGSFTVTTDHSNGSTWDDASLAITASTYDIYGFVLVTDSSATDLDVNLLSDASGDDFTIAWVSLRELSDTPLQDVPQVSDAMFDSDEVNGSDNLTAAFADVNDGGGALAATVKVPVDGTWRVRVSGMVTSGVTGGEVNAIVKTSGGTSTWEYPVHRHQSATGAGNATSGYEFVVFPATNGGTYTFTMQAKGTGTSPQILGTAVGTSLSDGEATTINAFVERVW